MTRTIPTVSVTVAHGAHKEGTKEYTLMKIAGPDGEILARRWGPIGAETGCKIERSLYTQKTSTYDGAWNERLRKGYDMHKIFEDKIDLTSLRDHLSARQLKSLTDADVNWIVKGWSKRDIPGTVEFGRNGIVEQITRDTKSAHQEKIEREKAEEEAALQSNPLFGMF